MIEQAKRYRDEYGFSIIPVMSNKKPAIPSWLEYQERYPTDKEIEQWWGDMPDCGIAIITGKLSNIVVLDIDSKEAQEKVLKTIPDFTTPMALTPRGSHLYFRYREGLTNTVNLMYKEVDLRGEGGYVVAPPSVNEEGKQYRWHNTLDACEIRKFPDRLTEYGIHKDLHENIIKRADVTLEEGQRDESLFHIAHSLVKGGMEEDDIRIVVSHMATQCNPPFPEGEAQTKVDSAIKRAIRKERPLSLEVEKWVSVTDGYFSVTDIYRALHIITQEDENNIKQIIFRLKERDVIERFGQKHGMYRRIERECEPIDWQNAPTDDIPLVFPLGLEELVHIYPGNIIIIAGESNAGKTAFMLDFIRLNMDKYIISYFNSEMGANELRIRLGLFKFVPEWKFTAWERSDHFADVIEPNSINIIDFLETTGEEGKEFWRVGGQISEIHQKLKDGIALIALQKNRGRDTGRGGELSLEKPRLYVAMGNGTMKIVKAKNWKGTDNPNGKVMDFKLYKGNEFSAMGMWHQEV